jgi:hypothetical protein
VSVPDIRALMAQEAIGHDDLSAALAWTINPAEAVRREFTGPSTTPVVQEVQIGPGRTRKTTTASNAEQVAAMGGVPAAPDDLDALLDQCDDSGWTTQAVATQPEPTQSKEPDA